jgi:hypothetical protein
MTVNEAVADLWPGEELSFAVNSGTLRILWVTKVQDEKFTQESLISDQEIRENPDTDILGYNLEVMHRRRNEEIEKLRDVDPPAASS